MAKESVRWVPGLYRPCFSQISSQPPLPKAACSVIASAQVVLTAVSYPGTESVLFTLDGTPTAVPLVSGVVEAVVTKGKEADRFVFADAVEVLTPSAHRVEPRCPVSGPGGCGGCDFQHVDLAFQRELG